MEDGVMLIEDKLLTFIEDVPVNDFNKTNEPAKYQVNLKRNISPMNLAETIREAAFCIRKMRNNAKDLETEKTAKYEVMKSENQKMGARSLALEIEVRNLKKELADVKNEKSIIHDLCMKKDGQLEAYRECFGKLLESQDRL